MEDNAVYCLTMWKLFSIFLQFPFVFIAEIHTDQRRKGEVDQLCTGVDHLRIKTQDRQSQNSCGKIM